MKEIVVPGEMIEERPVRVRHGYVENGRTYSTILGIYNRESMSIVPLEGVWTPAIEDTVVGIVSGVKNGVYTVDLNYHGRCIIISGKFDRFSFRHGDVVEAKIKNIEEKNTIILYYPRLLSGGTIVDVKPAKVPRVMGKGDTMIRQISDNTKSHIIVGKNGRVWIKGGDVGLATAAILRIEKEAHVSGLTERIREMIENKS